MDHIAIMRKSWGLIEKILSGEKKIESRWYRTKRTPWNKVSIGDTVFFKNAGEPVIAMATVSEVKQFDIGTTKDAVEIIKKYGKEICLVNDDPTTWGELAKYCILIRLQNSKSITPFQINKRGFGTGAAWISVPNVNKIKINAR